MKNYVSTGDYAHFKISIDTKNCLKISALNGWKPLTIKINPETVDSYELIGEESHTSGSSAVGRAAVGSFLLGPIGVAAALSAKKKGIHTIGIKWKDGGKSIIEIDDKLYKTFLSSMF